MYKNWITYTRTHPKISILIIAVVYSLLGILIEFILNKDFLLGGIFPVIAILLILYRRTNKKGEDS